MRNRLFRKNKLLSAELLLLLLTLYEVPIIPRYPFFAFKFLVLILIFLRNVNLIPRIMEVILIAACYAITIILSSILNRISLNSIFASVFFLVQLLDFYLVFYTFTRTKTFIRCVIFISIYFIVLLLITDGLIFLTDYNFANSEEKYFIGNKFTVSYVHCYLLILLLYIQNNKNDTKRGKKFLLCVYSAYCIYICSKVQCKTGIVVATVIILLSLLPTKMKVLLCNMKIIILMTTIINVLIFSSFSIFTIPTVSNIIVNVFHKSATITGRLYVYRYLIELIKQKPLLGYGYHSLITRTVNSSIYNTQNGVMEILIYGGVLGLTSYVCLISKSMFHKSIKPITSWPFFIFLYAMIIGSSVEITLTSTLLFMCFALVNAANISDSK